MVSSKMTKKMDLEWCNGQTETDTKENGVRIIFSEKEHIILIMIKWFMDNFNKLIMIIKENLKVF